MNWPMISNVEHTCDLCWEQIDPGVKFTHAIILDGSGNYRAHLSCEDVFYVIGDRCARFLSRAETFRPRLANLPTSDLCEILNKYPADEITRMVNVQATIRRLDQWVDTLKQTTSIMERL